MTKKEVRLNEKEISNVVKNVLTEYISGNSEPLNEMARIRQKKSGLPMIVWMNPNDGTNTGNHNMPRLKFQDNTNTRLNPSEMVPISIDSSSPTILVKNFLPKLSSTAISKLKKWIIMNYPILLAYWNNEIFEDELIDNIKPI